MTLPDAVTCHRSHTLVLDWLCPFRISRWAICWSTEEKKKRRMRQNATALPPWRSSGACLPVFPCLLKILHQDQACSFILGTEKFRQKKWPLDIPPENIPSPAFLTLVEDYVKWTQASAAWLIELVFWVPEFGLHMVNSVFHLFMSPFPHKVPSGGVCGAPRTQLCYRFPARAPVWKDARAWMWLPDQRSDPYRMLVAMCACQPSPFKQAFSEKAK